jgi:hypothetical protein
MNGTSAAFLYGVLIACGAAGAQVTAIELTPPQVGSSSASVFTALPTVSPGTFGFSGDVRGVNFDTFPGGAAVPSGTHISTQYASIGVLMNGVLVSNNVYEGPASAPNATFFNLGHIFTFTVPVRAAGLINTSPDRDFIEFWSGPNRTGTLLLTFRDQESAGSPNFHIDRFLGARSMTPAVTIGSMWFGNASGDLELDEMIFEVAPPLACAADLGSSGGLAGPDGLLDNNDFIVFINLFFDNNPTADMGRVGGEAGSDGQFDNNDFIEYINRFFAGCH